MQLDILRSHAIQKYEIDQLYEAVYPYVEYVQGVLERAEEAELEHVLQVPGDARQYAEITQVVDEKISTALQVVFLIGIGGSNLGTQAVAEAVRGRYGNHSPRLVLLDTVSEDDISQLKKQYGSLSAEEYMVFVISKSGTTVETVANTELCINTILDTQTNVAERMIIISDSNSPLYEFAREHNISALAIPQVVGGRFSIFTAVGLAPLHALGIDIAQLCAGAVELLEESVHKDWPQNTAMQSALHTFYAYQDGYSVKDLFCFDPALEGVGKWYRQLFAESLGKSENTYGESIETIMVPTVSIGSTDLHSMGQLYMAGPATIFTNFLFVQNSDSYEIPPDRFLKGVLPDLDGQTTHNIRQAIQDGVLDAYNDRGRPYVVETLDSTSAFEVGKYMQYKILEVLYMSVVLEVDPYNQPDVEAYKKYVREYVK